MSKLSYVLIAAIVFLIGAIIVTTFMQSSDVNPPNQKAVYTDLNVTLPSTSGAGVTTTNFLTDETVTSDTQNPGMYFLGNTFADNTPAYVVMYERESGIFNVTLLKEPLASARLEAEAYLKTLLAIDEKEMCKLSYMVTVPGYVSEEASGFDYRFSFCPGSFSI
jgi:hypothetical protein